MTANAWTSVAMAVLRIRPSQRHAVIEVGIGGRGQMEQYARLLRPDLTVVTSIGSEHHGSLGSLEVTRAEKVRDDQRDAGLRHRRAERRRSACAVDENARAGPGDLVRLRRRLRRSRRACPARLAAWNAL